MLSLPRAARHRTAIPHALVFAVAMVTLAGCGGSADNGVASKNASEILAAAKAAAQSATAVHVESRAAQGRLTLKQNLGLARDGGHAHISGLGLDFEVIRTSNTLYLKGNPTFYQRLGINPTRIPQNTWIKTHANNRQFAGLRAFTDLPGEVGRLLTSANPVTKGATTTANGQKTIELKQTGKLYTGKIYVATTGKPYPVQITRTGRETGRTTLTNWNQPVSLSVPSSTISIG
jgi:uncharacterized protein (DUF2147 family)